MRKSTLERYSLILLVNVLIFILFVSLMELLSWFINTPAVPVVRNSLANSFPQELNQMTLAKYRMYRTHREYHSPDYNVDSDGFRSSTIIGRQLERLEEARFTIFAFGGSSTFGTGTTDRETWPAILEQLLQQKGVNVSVLNLGQGGFDLHEEIYLVLDQLKRGYRPDLVIFLDGINECTTLPGRRVRCYDLSM